MNGDKDWSNSKAVEITVKILSVLGRKIETPKSARERLGLE